MQNANEAINLLKQYLTKLGLTLTNAYEKKKKILESEVTSSKMNAIQIGLVVGKIEELE